MRWNGLLISIAATALAAHVPLTAAVFGSVAVIGGQASDIALDESRGALYIANFTANRIEVMSTADNSIRTSFNVAPRPGALALSRDSQYLLVTHYGNTTPADPANNAVTLIDLRSNTRQTFVTGDAPLGVAFMANGQALLITTTSLIRFDPVSGAMRSVTTFANLAEGLPVEKAKFPGEVTRTALATSGDGYVVWGIAGAGTGDNQLVYRYDMRSGDLKVSIDASSPALLPRVSVSQDGSTAMIGWALFNTRALQGRYPNVQRSANITGHVMDSAKSIIYG
jgi:DNA-binding beta-propeller fold protein YncE